MQVQNVGGLNILVVLNFMLDQCFFYDIFILFILHILYLKKIFNIRAGLEVYYLPGLLHKPMVTILYILREVRNILFLQ